MNLIRYTEQPDLWSNSLEITREVWPEYNLHGDVVSAYWGRLFEDFPAYQFVLYEDEVLAEGHTLPCVWDGTRDGLGDGIDAMVIAAFEARMANRTPNALCALAAEIRPRFQGRGLARRILDAMTDLARGDGLTHLIAPVRPSFKERYPITPIERYVAWRGDGGEAFDPWIRVHLRRGGKIGKPYRPDGHCGSRGAVSEAAPPVRRPSRPTTFADDHIPAAHRDARGAGSRSKNAS